MDIKETLKEYLLLKTKTDFVLVFNRLNDQKYLETCEDIFYVIEENKVIVYYKHNQFNTTLIFPEIEQRNLFHLKKKKKLLCIENYEPDEKQNFNYTIRKEKKVNDSQINL